MIDRELVVLSLFPELMNVHGDAGNAAVLAARATWAGRAARVVDLHVGDSLPSVAPDFVVIGSGFDADAQTVLDALQAISAALHDWHASSVPLLAVATGWELLATEVELPFRGSGGATGDTVRDTIDGVGLFTGRSTAVQTPVNGHLVVDSVFGELVGYEYHLRDYALGAGESPLGRVVAGLGNSASSRVEGARTLNAFGTHIAGPLLARNPRFADQLLALASGETVETINNREAMDARTVRVDNWANAANARLRKA
jgi:CobQ-like glutamine amidotransferase family enzyme